MPTTHRQPNQRIASLYVLRIICVFLIVAIHYPMAGSEAFVPLLRTAVPLFFMTSGYFAHAVGRAATRSKLHRAFRKTLWIILYSNLIFGCLKLLIAAVGGEHVPIFSVTSPADWLRLLFIGNTILEYLWYLTAYMEALAVFILFFRLHAERVLFPAIPLFLAAGLLLGRYSFVLGMHESPPLWVSRNFLTLGLPFFTLGYLIRGHEQTLVGRFGRYAAGALVLLLAGVIVEGRLLAPVWRLGDLYLFTAPLAFAAFLLCIAHKPFGAGSWFDRAGEHHALNIYLFQAIVAGVVIAAGHRVLGFDAAPYAAPVVFLGSLLLSEVINRTHRLLRR